LKLCAVLHVPDLDRILLAPRRQAPAVRAKGHVHTRTGDPRAEGEAGCFLLVHAMAVEPLRVPELHDPVPARQRQILAIAVEAPTEDFSAVGIERADLPAGPGIPDLHGSVVDVSRDQVAAVGAERHGGFWLCSREL